MDLSLFQKPQINLARSTTVRMTMVSFCALLAIVQSSLSDGFHSLFVALAACAGALGTELLFNIKDRFYTIKDGSAVASALVLTLLLPAGINPLCAFVGMIFAMAVLKHSFGGLGSNWVNPAAGAALFIRSAWPLAFERGIRGGALTRLAASVEGGLRDPLGSPLGILTINGWQEHSLGRVLGGFLNNTVFAFSGVRLPQGYLSLFSPPGPGLIADRGLLFLLLGTMLLAASQSFRFWLPLVFLFVSSLLIWIFGALPFGGPPAGGDILFGLLSGGIPVIAFILITDPATGPKSTPGYLVFAVFVAVLAFLFRYPAMDPYGGVPAVLAGNAVVPLIRRIENKLSYDRRVRS
ncbi:MAG: RnfABCDGE type electron transport complex subunit D [Treponema sp.]|jgi:electron transport complex protein RnfD|nr:RnfABCDGE type electron transport complex subunit D [Treponema sp.]